MLTNCKNKNYALTLIRQNINLFDSFNNIFLFGSILLPQKKSSDIDILLLYSIYSERLIESVNNIYNTLNIESEIPVDLTVLSLSEEKELKFLEKQKSNYIKIK
jgi:predicted nucleotidyltransferase